MAVAFDFHVYHKKAKTSVILFYWLENPLQ